MHRLRRGASAAVALDTMQSKLHMSSLTQGARHLHQLLPHYTGVSQFTHTFASVSHQCVSDYCCLVLLLVTPRAYRSHTVGDHVGASFSVYILCTAALFCVTHFFWGRGQINCWLEHQDINEHWVTFINDYCYAQGTYFVPLDVAEPWRSHERIPVDYYQWASSSCSC